MILPENEILLMLEELKKTTLPIYIWGGAGGNRVVVENLICFLNNNSIVVEGCLVGQAYYEKDYTINGIAVNCLEDFCDSNEKNIVLICAHTAVTYEMLNNINFSCICKLYIMDIASAFIIPGEEINIYNKEFWKKNGEELAYIVDDMADDISKNALNAFIFQKRTSCYYKPYDQGVQYFDAKILNLQESEIFVDCGGYQGETVIDFIDFLKSVNISKWERIYTIEPEQCNFFHLREKLTFLDNITIINKAVGDKKEMAALDIAGDRTMVGSKGDIFVEVDTIDNIVGDGGATFIKMDLEGYEMPALHGAERTIRKFRPKLAVSVYHKKMDLIEIYRYIKSIHDDYSFYFRNYSPLALDAVLFAI